MKTKIEELENKIKEIQTKEQLEITDEENILNSKKQIANLKSGKEEQGLNKITETIRKEFLPEECRKVFIDNGSINYKIAHENSEGKIEVNVIKNSCILGTPIPDPERIDYSYDCDGLVVTFGDYDHSKFLGVGIQYTQEHAMGLHYAMNKSNIPNNKPIDLYITLAPSQFYKKDGNNNSVNKENLEKIKKLVLNKITSLNHDSYTINKVFIIPEGSALALSIDNNGLYYVADIGGTTIDIAKIHKKSILDTHSIEKGTFEIIKQIKTKLSDIYEEVLDSDADYVLKNWDKEEILKTYNLDENIINKIINSHLKTAVSEINMFAGGLNNTIYLAGGASLILEKVFNSLGFDNVEVIEQNETALVRAIYDAYNK